MGQWQSNPVCTTPACVHAASNVLQNMHPNWAQMDPCTQFDEMVCYGFEQRNDAEIVAAGLIQQRTNRILQQILDSPDYQRASVHRSTQSQLSVRAEGYDEHIFDMLRTSYQACVNADARKAAGVQPLVDIVVSIGEAWPISIADFETKVEASDYVAMSKAALVLEDLGIGVFHHGTSHEDKYYVVRNLHDWTTYTLFMAHPKVVNHKNITAYADPAAMKQYAETIHKALVLVYQNKLSETDAAQIASGVVEFETAMLGALSPYLEEWVAAQQGEEAPLELARPMTVAEFASLAPALGFDKLIASLSPSGFKITEVVVQQPAGFAKVADIVAKQPKTVVQNWMVWKAINGLNRFISDPTLDAILPRKEQRIGTTAEVTECLADLNVGLRFAMDRFFIEAAYSEMALKSTNTMTANIKAKFKERIDQLDWMSAESRARAMEKVDNMAENIGYQKSNPDVASAESVATYYQSLNITDSHFANMVEVLRHNRVKEYELLTGPVNRHDLPFPISDVNCFYDPDDNGVYIHAGFSQLPYFHPQLPDYANYAALGVVIGHEVTHGFDDTGRKHDKDGQKRAWWDNDTVAAYQERANCFVEQFSRFEVEVPGGMQNVNGSLTLGENIADAGGLNLAYAAWADERRAMPDVWDQDLPGLENFTHEQLFFLFFGNMWCSSFSPLANKADLEIDPHSPSSVRIRAIMKNSRDFQEAFSCPVKEPECVLW